MKVTIRRAVPSDTPRLLELLRITHAESNFADWAEFADESVQNFVAGMLAREDAEIIVADNDGELIGLITFIYLTPYYNAKAKVAYGLTIWADPKYAHLHIGRKLYKTGIQMAKNNGALYFDVEVRADNPGLVKFHQRYGATVHGTILRNRIN